MQVAQYIDMYIAFNRGPATDRKQCNNNHESELRFSSSNLLSKKYSKRRTAPTRFHYLRNRYYHIIISEVILKIYEGGIIEVSRVWYLIPHKPVRPSSLMSSPSKRPLIRLSRVQYFPRIMQYRHLQYNKRQYL